MSALAKSIGYEFRDASLLKLALTHPSLGKTASNQRLEFLGDMVLGLVIAELLYTLYPNEQEGELARRLAALVRGETLTEIAQEIGLGKAITMSAGEAAAGGREAASNLEDAVEALIGAIYLDGGLIAAKHFILPRWSERAKTQKAAPKDAKTSLQEWAQARGIPVPTYEVVEQKGPAHAPDFTVRVTVQGQDPKQATANSKRGAEQLAAQALLESL